MISTIRDVNYRAYTITQWYTLFDLEKYDIVLGKRWMHDIPYIVDHNDNNLHIVKRNISTDPANLSYIIKHTIKGLWPWEARYMKDESYNIVAKSSIDVLSAEETAHLLKAKKAELHMALV